MKCDRSLHSVDSSRTQPAGHTTAAKIGKRYAHAFPASRDPDKSSCRTTDGRYTSGAYCADAGRGGNGAPDILSLDYTHPIEHWLGRAPIRRLLKFMAAKKGGGGSRLERMLRSYRNPAAPLPDKIVFFPLHLVMDRVVTRGGWTRFRGRRRQFNATVKGLNVVARSVAEFGLTVPQKFSTPLFVVWNFTNRCNLRCKHCYQDSDAGCLSGELSRQEKLDLVGQMDDLDIPMLAISGGEPTLSADLLPVIRRASRAGMHLSLATNGTTLTPDRCAELRDAGLRYVEVSLDSVDPEKHDRFRGIDGMWRRAVAGARNVVATEGMRLGIAMCVHAGNIDEVEDMLRFAEHDLGASCFAHFNFIPVGRGLKLTARDISPAAREQLLSILNEKMQAGGMGVISTAPQLGRVCLAGAAPADGVVSCSHAGGGSGTKARAVAKYLGGCGAGRTYVAVEPNGDVTPCVYLPHRIMGNVREKPLDGIFRQSMFRDVLNDRTQRLHHCEVCRFRDYCGGCRARADAYFGCLNAGDPGCIFNEKHWERLLKRDAGDDLRNPSSVPAHDACQAGS